MIKKALSIALSVLMLISLMPAFVSAEDGMNATSTLGLTDAAYIRHSASFDNTVCGGSVLVVSNTDGTITASQRRMAFVKFDFDDYKDDLDSISEITLSLASIDSKADVNGNFTLAIMPDDKEYWDSSTLTFNIANAEMDMARADCGDVIYSGTMLKDEYVKTADIKDKIVSHLKDNPTNTIVTFKIDAVISESYQIYGMGSAYEPYLSITQTVDINSVLEEEYNALTFERINSSPQEAVVSDFNFVTSGTYGTVISWSSSDENTVNSTTGVVTQPKKGEGNKNVTLTATISNGDYSRQKEFEICVLESNLLPTDMLRSEIVYAYSTSYIRSGARKDNVFANENIVVDKTTTGSNHRMGFIKFDFSEYEDIIEQTQRITLRLDTFTDAKVENGSNFVVYVLPDSMEDELDSSTLTYAEAEKRGLVAYTDNLVYVSQSGLKPSATYETDDFYAKVRENLNENPDNKVVWLKIASTEGEAFTIYGNSPSNSNTIRPRLVLGYPKISVELDTIALKIPSLTTDDLELPQVGEYGSQILWRSSDESVISSEGKVNAGVADEDYSKEDPIVTLTATVINGDDTREKSFNIRAVRTGIMDATEDTYVNSDGNFADDKSIIFGGTSGNLAFIGFDITSDMTYMQKSRKTVLKVYATDENAGESIELSCITGVKLKNISIDRLSYDEAGKIADSETKFMIKSEFNSDGYAVFDITEYIMQLTDGNVLFSLKTDGPRISLYSTEGSVLYTPKLIASPIEFTDEYALQKASDELLFEHISSDPAESIRTDFTLPTDTIFGGTITWTSSDAEAINSSDGSIMRGSVNKSVTLTATIHIGKSTIQKSFDVVIIKQETDFEYAMSLASTLDPECTLLTSSITLPGEDLPAGAEVTWSSSRPEAKIEGYNLIIKRPSAGDLAVTITATVTYNGVSASKDYNLTLIRSADKNILRNRKIVSGDVGAANAIDENINTVWHIQNNEVVYDMGLNRVVSGLTIIPCVNSFSGVSVYASKDNLLWENVYSGGIFIKNLPNYINLKSDIYTRYLKLEFPNSASDICFLAAYSTNDYSEEDVFASVTVPNRASGSFSLVTDVNGNEVKWKSSSSLIKINGSHALVTQGTTGENVTITARIIIDGTEYEKSYVVYVPASSTAGGGSSGGGGGSSSNTSSSTHFVAIPPIDTQTTPNADIQTTPETKDKFSDISGYDWARECINSLAEKNIISGKEEGKFYPQDNIKREEMAKILVLAFDIGMGSSNGEFSDVKAGSWYEEYVYSLISSGGASGIGNGMFGTGQNITRQDAFKMIVSVLGVDTASYDEAQFKDLTTIADYAVEYVNALYAMGIIHGDDNGCINPNSYITRAEAAKVIYLAMEYVE